MKRCEKDVGRMVIAGFDGTEIGPALIELIEEYRIGGVILFKRNIKSAGQLKSLTAAIKETAGDEDFLVAVDHEGGRVFRLPPPFTQTGPAAILGEDYRKNPYSKKAYDTGRLMAGELLEAGINLNFAPVLDINTNPHNPVIGDRAIDEDPEITAAVACEWIRGLNDGGVLCCGKHFPGHGDTSVDSHLGLPVLHHTINRLRSIELVPFKRAISADIPSIMTAHVIYGAIDPWLPATLSKRIVAGLLRYELGFDKVVFTDDMLMKAILDRFAVEAASLMSIQAGCDMIIISRDFDAQISTIRYLKDALKKGVLTKERVSMSLRRIEGLARGVKAPV